jgi:hypothetical protein
VERIDFVVEEAMKMKKRSEEFQNWRRKKKLEVFVSEMTEGE